MICLICKKEIESEKEKEILYSNDPYCILAVHKKCSNFRDNSDILSAYFVLEYENSKKNNIKSKSML